VSTEAEAAESAAMAAVMAAAAVLSVAEPDALRTHPPRSRSYRGRAAYAPSATSGPSASVALGCLHKRLKGSGCAWLGEGCSEPRLHVTSLKRCV